MRDIASHNNTVLRVGRRLAIADGLRSFLLCNLLIFLAIFLWRGQPGWMPESLFRAASGAAAGICAYVAAVIFARLFAALVAIARPQRHDIARRLLL